MQARVAATEFSLFIYLRATYMMAFLCRILFNPYITEIYIPIFIWLKHPLICRVTLSPFFIRIIATPPTTIFQNGMPNVVLESPSNVRAAYHPYPTPSKSHQLHESSCTQPCMSVFIFWIAYLSSQNTGKYIYILSRFLYPILSSAVVHV